MKRRIAPFLCSVCIALAAGAMASGETVFVNLDKLYRNYYKTKLAYTQLKAQADRIKTDNESLLQEFNELQEKYEQLRTESLDDALSAEIRANKRNAAEETLIDLQNKGKGIGEAEERASKLLQKDKAGRDKRILEKIRDAIQLEAQTKGYLVVHNVQNVGATPLQGVMTIPYYDPDSEITDDVLRILNKGYAEDESGDEGIEAVEGE